MREHHVVERLQSRGRGRWRSSRRGSRRSRPPSGRRPPRTASSRTPTPGARDGARRCGLVPRQRWPRARTWPRRSSSIRPNVPLVLQPVADRIEARPALEGEERLVEEVRLGIARHRDVLDVGERQRRPSASTLPIGLRGEAGPVLDAVEALLLDAGVEETALEEGRRGIAVESVDSKDVHRRVSIAVESRRQWLRTGPQYSAFRAGPHGRLSRGAAARAARTAQRQDAARHRLRQRRRHRLARRARRHGHRSRPFRERDRAGA